MQPTRTRIVVVSSDAVGGAICMTRSDTGFCLAPVDTRPKHVRENQAPRSQRRR